MRKLLGKQMTKRNVSALAIAGIIIVGGYLMRRLAGNKSKRYSIESNL